MNRNIKNISKITTLVAVDLSAFYGSLFAAFYTRKFLTGIIPVVLDLRLSIPYFLKIWWMPIIFIAFIAYERLYIKNLPFWDETYELLKAVTVSMVTVLALVTIGRMTPDISRLTVIFLWIYGLLIFPFFRYIGKKMLFSMGIWKENVVILGAGKAGIDTAKGLLAENHLGYNIIGFLDDDNNKIGKLLAISGRQYKVFGKTKNFKKFITMLNISTIIIAMPSLPIDKLAAFANNIQKYTKNILISPEFKGLAVMNTELNHLFFQQLFLLKINNNLKSPFNKFIKRSFDLTVSVLFLPVLIPLIAILGLLIRIDSPGPVFFYQRRVGRGGGMFKVYKFRSMYRDSKERLENILKTEPAARQEWNTFFKLKNDPRITRMGAFLRKTSLDELPQILNVLKSEMSLVGPRPVLPEELAIYYKEFSDYYQLVRPGMTGLWQVSGRNDIDYDVRVKLDTWYVLNWSLWLDILMLFKTIRVVLKREGAY